MLTKRMINAIYKIFIKTLFLDEYDIDILYKKIFNKLLKLSIKPKREPTSYNLFCKEHSLSPSNIKDIAIKWNSLDPIDKEKYNINKIPKIIKPKRPKTSYNFFVEEHYPIIKSKLVESNSTIPIFSVIGRMWKLLDDRSKYESLASLDKKRYNNEIGIKIKKTKQTDDIDSFISSLNKKDKPKKDILNLFINKYINEYISEHSVSNKIARKELTKTWDEMDDEDKEDFINNL